MLMKACQKKRLKNNLERNYVGWVEFVLQRKIKCNPSKKRRKMMCKIRRFLMGYKALLLSQKHLSTHPTQAYFLSPIKN